MATPWPSRPIRSAARFAPVLDLPGVVEGVPRDPVCGVARRPALAGQHVAVRRGAEDREHLGAKLVELLAIARRELLALDPHDAGVSLLSAEHVVDDLRRVAAAA